MITCLGLLPTIRNRVKRYLYLKPKKIGDPALLYWKGDNKLKKIVYNENNWHLSHADGDEGFAP